ncbi:MAG TPA: YbjN domain-containing protein [Blastocatellia bacterium]|nr:YbjN domain-containing protein [Blastocatellia bacterium]
MKRKTTALVLITLAALASSHTGLHTSYAQDSSASKVARLLEESSLGYSKASNNVWSVPFQGKALPNFLVVASVQQDILVLFVVVAEKKDIRVAPELMQKMLKMNADLDRVKIGFDKDGDAFVRIDLSIRVLDVQEFKANIEQVAAAADELFTAIKPFIKITK